MGLIKKFFWLIFLIIGCAVTPELPKELIQTDLNQNLGFMIGSFSRDSDAEQFNAYSFFFRDVSKTISKRIFIMPDSVYKFKFKDDFSDEKVGGALFGFVLPKGEYEFYNFDLFTNLGIIQNNYGAKHDFSIPFTITPGQINYVGEIKFSADSSLFVISNQKDRDLPLFKEKFPNLDWNELVIAVPIKGNVIPQIVKFE